MIPAVSGKLSFPPITGPVILIFSIEIDLLAENHCFRNTEPFTKAVRTGLDGCEPVPSS